MRFRRSARQRIGSLGTSPVEHSHRAGRGPLSVLGALVTAGLNRAGVVTAESGGPTADRTRGAAVVIACGFASIAPVLGLVVAVGGWHLPRLLASRSALRARRVLEDEVFLAVQLSALAVSTGTTVPQTIAAVTPHLTGRLGASLDRALGDHRAGTLLDDGLDTVAVELGEPVAALIGIFRAAHTDGDPVEPALVRLGDRLRDERRRSTEAEVRKLSVRLLIPLVCCSLPGFVLIAVVPLAVNALGGLAR